jgi:hypothetical protein
LRGPATTFSVLDRSCYYRRPSSTFTGIGRRGLAADYRPVLTEEGESMRIRIVAFAIVITVTLTAAPGFAHHSDVAYDQAKRTTLKDAKVISYAWRNPHGIMVLDVKDETGEVVRWTLETGSPSSLMTDGWTKNSVVAGDVITVDANPARNGTKFGRLLRVTKADGTVLRISLRSLRSP